MKVLITGADGFIGKNLRAALLSRTDIEVVTYVKGNNESDLYSLIQDVEFIFHFAGVNRPDDPHDFLKGNVHLTKIICDAVRLSGRIIPILFSSSAQANQKNLYGVSKKKAEEFILKLNSDSKVPIHIFRLPNVFGKWCKPNYNSVVATFCYNINRGLPVKIDDPEALLSLVFIDDVINRFINLMDGGIELKNEHGFEVIDPLYRITVSELASQLKVFKNQRLSLEISTVGSGFLRALFSTYISYTPTNAFAYEIKKHEDSRGVFVEMLKTFNSGQFSYFTSYPRVTRGEHYHHVKIEKFLVIKGLALFRFRNIDTDEIVEYIIDGNNFKVIESIPGWAHDITNIGNELLIVMLWSNEIFNKHSPDTYPSKLVNYEGVN